MSEKAERRESKNCGTCLEIFRSRSSAPQVLVAISEVFGCFWCHTSANIPKLSLSLAGLPKLISVLFGSAANFTQLLADLCLGSFLDVQTALHNALHTLLPAPFGYSDIPHDVPIFCRRIWIWAHDLVMVRDSFSNSMLKALVWI